PLEPSAPARTFRMELADIDVPAQGMATDHPVVDVKLHNSGGDAVVLKRLTVDVSWARRFAVLPDLLPYVDTSGPLMLRRPRRTRSTCRSRRTRSTPPRPSACPTCSRPTAPTVSTCA
ncbi:MAG: hypothetical protein LC635_05390, partial [Pseudonocardiaceae bacterium]|nr:hypothetical protein [Pseudonocardiaceae bacterium]